MHSFIGLIKDKRSLVFEVLYSLEGIVGDLVSDRNNSSDVLHLDESALNQSIGLSQINLIKQLLQLSNHYIRVNQFVFNYSSDLNSYNRRLAQTIDKLLINYRNDLIEVEKDINRDSEYSLLKFNKFLKYSQTFEFLNEIISQFNEEVNSFGLTLDLINKSSLSGFTRIQNCAKIVYESSDSMYSDIWSWIMFGFLSEKSQNHFFIRENETKMPALDMSRVPPFISPIDAIKVHQIGQTIRSAKRRGVLSLFANKEKELFERFYSLQNNSSFDKSSFSQFIEHIRSIVSEHTWYYVVNDQHLKNHLMIIKSIYLTANDNFWSLLVFQISNIELNGQNRFQRDIENAFDTCLRQAFNESTANQLLSYFTINVSNAEKIYTIFLNYKIPVSLQNILSIESIKKYNQIMNLMIKLYSTRFELNRIWFKTMKPKLNTFKSSSLQIKAWSLRNSLSFIINCFYYYFKINVIERLFTTFMDKIERTKDIEEIQKEHQIMLTDIMGQMFLKTSVINKCLEQLFSECNRFKECLESEDLLNQLISEFERTKGQIYHLLVNIENYRTNQMISNLVLELEKCSKQQIIFN